MFHCRLQNMDRIGKKMMRIIPLLECLASFTYKTGPSKATHIGPCWYCDLGNLAMSYKYDQLYTYKIFLQTGLEVNFFLTTMSLAQSIYK